MLAFHSSLPPSSDVGHFSQERKRCNRPFHGSIFKDLTISVVIVISKRAEEDELLGEDSVSPTEKNGKQLT